MPDLKAIVDRLAAAYGAKKTALPSATVLEAELHQMSGIDESDPSKILLLPLDSDALQYVGSACGSVGNRVFSNALLVGYLREKGVHEFLGIIYDPDAATTYDHGSIPLASIAVPLAGKDARKVEALASRSGGSFRQEDSRVRGWSVYESE
jgi:hypothetical protein